jgi:hypothetical protein
MRSPRGFGMMESSMQAWSPSGSWKVNTLDMQRVGSWRS